MLHDSVVTLVFELFSDSLSHQSWVGQLKLSCGWMEHIATLKLPVFRQLIRVYQSTYVHALFSSIDTHCLMCGIMIYCCVTIYHPLGSFEICMQSDTALAETQTKLLATLLNYHASLWIIHVHQYTTWSPLPPALTLPAAKAGPHPRDYLIILQQW